MPGASKQHDMFLYAVLVSTHPHRIIIAQAGKSLLADGQKEGNNQYLAIAADEAVLGPVALHRVLSPSNAPIPKAPQPKHPKVPAQSEPPAQFARLFLGPAAAAALRLPPIATASGRRRGDLLAAGAVVGVVVAAGVAAVHRPPAPQTPSAAQLRVVC